jgi:hypothetical protein
MKCKCCKRRVAAVDMSIGQVCFTCERRCTWRTCRVAA